MIVGIDLGTTNSAVAIFRDGKAELITNRLGHLLTPSAVSLAEDGSLLVGLAARERLATHPELTATSFKRYMGTERRLTLGKTQYRPEELSSFVLRQLKEDAETALGEPVTEAIITVPAYFNDKQRRATKQAGLLAGLKVDRLINEPTAAAMAYGIHNLDTESRYLVFDLGGGTFDVSVVEIFEGIIEVRSSTGDNRLGGDDFNEILVSLANAEFERAWGERAAGDTPLHAKTLEAAERTRRTLTDGSAELKLVWKNAEYCLALTPEQFEAASEPLLKRLREPVLRAVKDAKIAAAELDEIILIGGATRMPLVRRAVTRMFGRFPNNSVDPDVAVALGAAIQAGLKSRDGALKEVVVTDVCPYSLGVGTSRQIGANQYEDGIFSPIIERSTVIPASRVETYGTLQDNQPLIHFEIFQGEARKVSDNVKIGELNVPMPRGKAGQLVEVRFSYDISGLLEVDIHVPATDHRQQLVIHDGEHEDERELARRRRELAKLKLHPADESENKAAIARAERCYENHLGEIRDYVGMMIDRFSAALHSQDPRTVETARASLLHELDQIEGDSFL